MALAQVNPLTANEYSVIEANDWFDLATGVLINPGKMK
jgi:hypothetical protein